MFHFFPGRNHEKLSGDIIQETDSDEKQTGTNLTHDKIPDSCQDTMSILPDHDHAAGRYGIDLHKYVAGKQVVGVDHGKKGGHHHINQHKEQINLGGFHIRENSTKATKDGQDHDQSEKGCHESLQDSCSDLIAPWCGEMSHHIGEFFSRLHRIEKHTGRKNQNDAQHYDTDSFCPFPIKSGGNDPGKHGQDNGKERKIHYKAHGSSSSFLHSITILSMSRVR